MKTSSFLRFGFVLGLVLIGLIALLSHQTLIRPAATLLAQEDDTEITEITPEITRIAGKDRYVTSRLVAEALYDGLVETIVLVSGNDFPDALSAAPLAAKLKAPILLCDQNIQGSGAATEYIFKHLQKDGTVYIVGGEKVIGGAEELEEKGYHVKRLSGKSRYGTNLAVVEAMNVDEGTPVFIASGEEYADALSVSSIAGSYNYPILLVEKEGMTSKTHEYIQTLQPEVVYLIGGVEVVSDQIFEGIKSLVPQAEIKRLAGRDRFETGIEVIKEFIDEPSQLYFASGYNFADALSGSVMAAQTGAPIILVNTEVIEPPIAIDLYLNELFQDSQKPEIAILGGSRVITNALAETLQNIIYQGFETEQLKSYRQIMTTGLMDYSKLIGPKPNRRDYLTISAIGDCTLGTDPRYAYSGSLPQAYDQFGAAYFFSGVKDILGKDDLTIANLETALTLESELSDKSAYLYKYWFKGDPEYVEILKQGSVEAVHIANNHIMDFKKKGYQDTLDVLRKEELSYFGYDHIAYFEKKGIRIGLFGLNLVDFKATAANMQNVKQEIASKISALKKEAQVIIVSFHWGSENNYQVKEVQKTMGRFAIDQGADLVLGHHPHVLEPIEQYKGKTIVYSLGNFVFGGNHNPWDKDTIIFQQALEFVNGEFWGLTEPKIIPCKISSVNSRNDYKPVVVKEKKEVDRIRRKVKRAS